MTQIAWKRADIPPGVVLHLPGVSLNFDAAGHLKAYADEVPHDLSRMVLARVEKDSDEFRLIFEKVPDLATKGIKA